MTLAITTAFALAAAATSTASGPVAYPVAQSIADGTVAENPGMVDAILHVSPAPGAANVVIAAHLTRANGEASGADDLGVMDTGAPLVEIQKDGVRLGILVQMRDRNGKAIGALGLMYAYRPGDDVEAAVRRSFGIRDHIAARIGSVEDLTRREVRLR